MTISPALLAMIARKLYAEYRAKADKGEINADFLLDESKTASALKDMIEQGLLHLGTNTEESDFAAAIKLAKNAIRNVQRSTGGALKVDGLLGENVLKWLGTRPFGHLPIRPLNKSTKPLTPKKTGKKGENTIRFFVETGHLSKLKGLTESRGRKLLNEAWYSWQKVCNLDVKRSGNRTQSNVVVEVGILKGEQASVLAVADIGPPGGNQLLLKFDETELWDDHRFQYTAAHEIGHLLGLFHLTAKRSLMNDFLHKDFKTPQTADKKKAVSIWGPRV